MAMSAKQWYVVDAEGLRLGRMSSEIAKILLGKNKPEFTPGALMGDCVVVINADKVIVTGKKRQDKLYRRHSGRPGGMTIESFDELQIRIPERCARVCQTSAACSETLPTGALLSPLARRVPLPRRARDGVAVIVPD